MTGLGGVLVVVGGNTVSDGDGNRPTGPVAQVAPPWGKPNIRVTGYPQKAGAKLHLEVKALADKFQDVVIDAGGRDNPELRAAMIVADVFVAPVLPSSFDFWGLTNVHRLVQDARIVNPDRRVLVFVNTLMIQRIHTDPPWTTPLETWDLAAPSPLVYHHINPYGLFEMDLDARIPLGDMTAEPVPAT